MGIGGGGCEGSDLVLLRLHPHPRPIFGPPHFGLPVFWEAGKPRKARYELETTGDVHVLVLPLYVSDYKLSSIRDAKTKLPYL